jgi:acetyl esterase/lipase
MSSLAAIPVGALVFAVCTALALVPARRPRAAAVWSWVLGMVPSEVPGLVLFIVVVTGVVPDLVGGLSSTRASIGVVLGLVTASGLVLLAWRATRARPAMASALDEALPPGWRESLDPDRERYQGHHPPWWQLVVPWPRRPRSVERVTDVSYGPEAHQRADVYRHWSRPRCSPTLILLHGGRFRWGGRGREARSLLHRLAAHGWTCISANYWLAGTPGEAFPGSLIDAKRVIAWARAEGAHHGVDREVVLVAGSSAGAHLATTAALTPNDPTLQPGFEGDDTSVAAAVGLSGYYGPVGGPLGAASSPVDHVDEGAPPILLVHGDHDTYTPVEGARAFAARLRETSRQPIALAELPGAQHSFDVFPSTRFERVVDGIEDFADWVRSAVPVRSGRRSS